MLLKVGFKVPFILEKRYLLVRWVPPISELKANIDGSSNLSTTGGGGIVRDSQGKVIFAFSKYYGNITNNEAEMRAV